jgi:hypothetical protein
MMVSDNLSYKIYTMTNECQVEHHFAARLSNLDKWFDAELAITEKKMEKQDARLLRLDEKVQSITGRLEAVIDRAGARMAEQEVNAASQLEHVEAMVERLAATVHELCEMAGLPSQGAEDQYSYGWPRLNEPLAVQVTRMRPVASASASESDVPVGASEVPSTPPSSTSAIAASLLRYVNRTLPSSTPGTPEPMEALAQEPLASGMALAAAPLGMDETLAVAPLPHPEQATTVVHPPYPGIHRTPATPVTSQDSAATHVTLLSAIPARRPHTRSQSPMPPSTAATLNVPDVGMITHSRSGSPATT